MVGGDIGRSVAVLYKGPCWNSGTHPPFGHSWHLGKVTQCAISWLQEMVAMKFHERYEVDRSKRQDVINVHPIPDP